MKIVHLNYLIVFLMPKALWWSRYPLRCMRSRNLACGSGKLERFLELARLGSWY